MSSHRTHHIDPASEVAQVAGGVQRACLYLLGERTHVAAQGSAAEQRLLDRGAFPVAVLSFDPPLAEPAASQAALQGLAARDAAVWLAHWITHN